MEKEAESQSHREVVCLVFMRAGRLLLEQRLEDDNFRGRWTFIGGKVEESDRVPGKEIYLKVAAAREALEEANLKPTDMQVFTSFEGISRNGGQYLFHGVLVRQCEGRVRNKEPHKRTLRWVPLEEAAKYIGDTEVDKKVLESFLLLLKS